MRFGITRPAGVLAEATSSNLAVLRRYAIKGVNADYSQQTAPLKVVEHLESPLGDT